MCNNFSLPSVRWSSLSGLTLWRLRGSRSFLLMTLTGTTPGLVRNLVLLQYHVWTKISRFCASIWFLILSLQPQLQGRSTSGKALGWVDSRRSMVAARGTAPAHHTSARAVVPFHATSCSSCRRWASLMLIPRGNPIVKCLCLAWQLFVVVRSLLIVCFGAVGGSSPPREGVILTKWLEELLLTLKHLCFLFCPCSMVWLHFICSFELGLVLPWFREFKIWCI